MSDGWVPAPPPVVAGDDCPVPPPATPTKVLHVITRLEAGAGGNTLLSALGMDPRRYEVWIAAAPGGSLWARAAGTHVRTAPIRALRREVAPLADLVALRALVRLIRRERFAVVHVHSAKAGVLGRIAAALCGVPVVVYTLHGRDPWWPAPDGSASELGDVMPGRLALFLFCERALRRVTHRFVAVAPTVARDAVLAGVAAAGRVDVAPSAVDLAAIPSGADPAALADLGVPPGAPVVGTVGRLDAQKAPLDFVRMAALVAGRRPGTRFVMVGDGEQAAAAAALADELGVRVTFTGYRGDAPRLAAAFDVFVVTSLYEGVGRSVTEAMASARPVVATAVDGVVDVVAPGATGLLAAPRDVVGLADRVGWLLDHPAEAARMGEQARARVRELFTAERMCATLDRVYCALLGVTPPAAPEPQDIPHPRRLTAAAAS